MINLTEMLMSATDSPQDWAEIYDLACDDGVEEWFREALSYSVCLSQWFRTFTQHYAIHQQCNTCYNRARTHPSPSSVDTWVWRYHHERGEREPVWSAAEVPSRLWPVLNSMDDLRARRKEIPAYVLAWASFVLPQGEYRIQGTVEWWIVARPKKIAQVGRELLRRAPPLATIVV